VADAVLGQNFHVTGVIARIDDHHAALVELEVPLDERKRATADGPEPIITMGPVISA
jgi:hypothetical protein